MVQLSLYRPPAEVENDAPQILSFERFAASRRGRMVDVIARARMERENTQCPCCRRVTVQPIERPDAIVNRNGATIPGTATIVGFQCNACRHQWRVRERA